MAFTDLLLLLMASTSFVAVSPTVVASSALPNSNVTAIRTPTFDARGVAMFAPCFDGVQTTMVGAISEFKIFDPVVSFVVVLVMHDFTTFKVSAKMLSHDKPMFKDVLPVVADKNVPPTMYLPAAFPCRVIAPRQYSTFSELNSAARFRACYSPRFFDSVSRRHKFDPALRACQRFACSMPSSARWTRAAQDFEAIAPATCRSPLENIRTDANKLIPAIAQYKPARLAFVNADETNKLEPVDFYTSEIAKVVGTPARCIDAFRHVVPFCVPVLAPLNYTQLWS